MTAAASTTDPHTAPLGTAPPPPPRRPRVLLMGTVFAGTAASVAIAALVAVYTKLRADFLAREEALGTDTPWLDGVHVELTPGTVAFSTLVLSAVTAAAVGYCLRRGDRPNALFCLATTLLLGVAFITGTAFFWQQLDVGVAESQPALLIVMITGAHLAMVAAGLLYLSVMGFHALGGQLTGRSAEGYNAAVVFWFMTIAMYSVVWYAITITK